MPPIWALGRLWDDGVMRSRVVFRPWTGIALTVLVWAVVVVSLAGLAIAGDIESLRRFGPAFVALGAVTWSLFWLPAVRVDDAGVVVQNPLRTTAVPWSRIDGLETRFGLKLVLRPSGTVSAWGAPAASRRQSAALLRQSRATASRSANEALEREAMFAEGEAAMYIRRELTRRERTGELGPEADVVRTPNIPVAVGLAVVLVAAVALPFT